MQQQTSTRSHEVSKRATQASLRGIYAHPKRLDIFLHGVKTLKLIGALVTDPRIPLLRKIFFFASIAGLAVVLFFPDALSEVFLSTVMPVIGTVLGVPLDAGFDWVAFALAAIGLLRFFPAELVAEHYEQIFKRHASS